jgi:hypothetical protein
MDYRELYRKLAYAIRLYPELRIGQLLVNAAHKGGWEQDDIFYCDNKTLMDGLQIMIDARLR